MRFSALGVSVATITATVLCACGASERSSNSNAEGSAASGGALAGAPSSSGAPAVGGVGGAGGAGGVGGAGGAGGAAGSGVAGMPGAAGAPPPPPLDVHSPEAAAECDPEVCSVTHDWDAIEIQADTFDEFRIATSADTTYLTLETLDRHGDRRRFIALDDAGNVEIDQGLVPQIKSPFLAVDGEGSPHVLGYLSQPAGSGMRSPVQEEILRGMTWTGSTVEGAIFAYGFEVDPSGRSIAQVSANVDQMILATREDDAWSQAPLPPELHGLLALDVNGKPIFYSADGEDLWVYDGAGTPIFSRPVPAGTLSSAPGYVTFASQPAPLARTNLDLELAVLLEDGLHVLLFDRASGEPSPGPVDVPLPDSAEPAIDCPQPDTGTLNAGQNGAECAPSCSFMGSGLAPEGSFSLTRTADGALFLAYVIADYDLTYLYTWHTGPTGLSCIGDGPTGTWTSTLHVARIAPDGSALTEALTAPIGQSNGARIEPTSGTWAVQARSFGQRVVVGVAQRPGSGLAGVRVTAFDAVVE